MKNHVTQLTHHHLTGRYDDVDAVEDLPTAYYYEQMLQVYPSAKFILTVRDEKDWLKRCVNNTFFNFADNCGLQLQRPSQRHADAVWRRAAVPSPHAD